MDTLITQQTSAFGLVNAAATSGLDLAGHLADCSRIRAAQDSGEDQVRYAKDRADWSPDAGPVAQAMAETLRRNAILAGRVIRLGGRRNGENMIKVAELSLSILFDMAELDPSALAVWDPRERDEDIGQGGHGCDLRTQANRDDRDNGGRWERNRDNGTRDLADNAEAGQRRAESIPTANMAEIIEAAHAAA